MARTDKFRQQHNDLLILVSELQALLDCRICLNDK
jgi:hypothetical protein